MAQLIDTSVLIEMEHRGLQLDDLALVVTDEPAALAAITASELLTGVYRADSTRRRLERETFVEASLERLPVLPFDLGVARVHARLWAQLATSGQLIGAHDLIIAATAIANSYSVLTDNIREFQQRVPELVVVQPDW